MLEVFRLFLVYGASCSLLLWVAHRWLGRIRPAIALILLLLPLVSTGGAMTSGGFYGALNLAYHTPPLLADADRLPKDEWENGVLADQIYQVVPWRKAIRELVKTGHLPLLNRFSRGGDPLLAAAQPAPFDPKVWLGFLLPLATAVTFACSFVFFQAAFFTYLFARDLGVSAAGALMAGAVFMMCGFLDFYVTWSLASVVAAMPLLLLGLRRIARGEEHGVAAAGVAWVLALVGGHPESALHVTVVGGVVFLWQLRSSPDRRRALLVATGTGLVVLALAAPVVLPFVEVLPETTDFNLRKHSHAEAGLPWSEAGASALAALYPHGWGEPWAGGRAELPSRFNAASGAFVGSLALALALVGAIWGPRQRIFFAALAGVTFALAVGTPILSDALAALPLFSMALNGRLVFVTAFALAMLAAFGFDLLRLEPTRRRLAAVLAVTLAVGAGGFARLGAMEELSLETSGHVYSLGWLISIPVAVVISALLWRRSPQLLAALWLGLFLVGQRGALPHFYETLDRRLFYPPVPELSDLPRGGEPYRIVARHYDLVPGQSALFELEDMRGPSVMSHRRLTHLSRAWCVPVHAWFCRVDELDSPLLDLFNVRFVVGDPTAPAPAGWTPVERGRHLAVFENPQVLPRAFVPQEIEWVGPHFPVAEQMKRAEDFRRLAWIEGAERSGRTKNGRATVRTRADGPDLYVEVDAAVTDAGSGPWVLVSQTFWPGWRAVTSDGRRLPLLPADHAFMAFEAPPGRSEVRLFYRPRGWDVGWAVAGAAMLVCLVLVLFRRRVPLAADEDGAAADDGAADDGSGGVPSMLERGRQAVGLSVVIPAFDEESRLPAALGRALDYLDARFERDSDETYEVIVVDDGSSDGTSRVAASFDGVRVLRLEQNQGKGAAVRRGVLASRGRRVLITDADGSIPIEELGKLAGVEVPIAIASRTAPGAVSERHRPRLRRLMSRFFNTALRLAGVAGGVGDTQCGFKLFDGDVAHQLFRRAITPGFAFDVEILWLARRCGYRIEEVGVRWCDQPSSRVRPWLDAIRMLLEVARFSWYHRTRGRGAPSRSVSSGEDLQPARNL